MMDNPSPPVAAGACLDRPYPAGQKGGTLIAEDAQATETPEGQQLASLSGLVHRLAPGVRVM